MMHSAQQDDVTKSLATWVASLNSQLDQQTEKLNTLKKQNAKTHQVRTDLHDLIDYMVSHDLPPGVLRILEVCLSWNPHTK